MSVHAQLDTSEVTQTDHSVLLDLVKEVALTHGITPPNVYTTSTGSADNTFAAPITHDLVVSEVALDLLNPEELKALLGHEMQHFKQEHFHKHAENTLFVIRDHFTRWLARNNLPGGQQLRLMIRPKLAEEIEKTTLREMEADLAGASIATPEAMVSALIKVTAEVLQVDISELSKEDAINEIDKAWAKFATNRIAFGKLSFSERITHIEESSQTFIQ